GEDVPGATADGPGPRRPGHRQPGGAALLRGRADEAGARQAPGGVAGVGTLRPDGRGVADGGGRDRALGEAAAGAKVSQGALIRESLELPGERREVSTPLAKDRAVYGIV